MNTDEVIDLLTTAAAFDRRKVGDADVIAWQAAVGDLPFADAQAAVVKHYTETTEWLMPAHVRTLVKKIRADRIAAHAEPIVPADVAENAGGYIAQFRAALEQMASGWSIARGLVRGQGAEPNEEFVAGRGEGLEHRRLRLAAVRVQCPRCRALTNDRCVNAVGAEIGEPAHDARFVAAGLARWVEVNGQQRAEMLTPAAGERTT